MRPLFVVQVLVGRCRHANGDLAPGGRPKDTTDYQKGNKADIRSLPATGSVPGDGRRPFHWGLLELQRGLEEIYYAQDHTRESTCVKRIGMERFFASLERLSRYEVRRGRVGRRGPDKDGNYEQKMVDVLLSIDLVKFSSKGKITHAVLIAGDGDFVPAVKMAKDEAVIVYLVYGKSRHDALWKEVDERMEITQEFVERVKWT